eukprot:jgi/Mesvir1/13047/Mv06035-RA.1
MPKACAFCGSDANLKACGGCGTVWYCSTAHQKACWKDHKAACKEVQARRNWAVGLSPASQHEWLVDCYRMRVDDMCAYQGDLKGLYNPEHTSHSVARDFLVFCKLALRQGVVPLRGWDWVAFLSTAAPLLRYAFEKSDAKEKYGSENVFSGALGGRSLRFTAMSVYGSGVDACGERSEEECEVEKLVYGLTRKQLWGRSKHLREVGGKKAWQDLVAALRVILKDEERGFVEDDDEDEEDDDDDLVDEDYEG